MTKDVKSEQSNATSSTSHPKQVAAKDVEQVATCESEIYKYDWQHSTAIAVARAESGLNTNALNNNPATGDYSVGCFQINLYGANAYSRPSEQELRDPVVNVAYAYKLYTGAGKSFISNWGVCRGKVACY